MNEIFDFLIFSKTQIS